MIEIDDAGTGDLVGDAFIGVMKKNGKIIFRTLPVEYFQGDRWKNKEHLDKTVEVVKDALNELQFDKNTEKIQLCRGNIFDKVRTYFDEEGINYEPAIIEGKLQDAVEQRYINHLRNDLGIKSRKLTIKSGAKRYFVLFNWVTYDVFNREKYVKSGFKRWNTIWREKAIEKFNERRRKSRN